MEGEETKSFEPRCPLLQREKGEWRSAGAGAGAAVGVEEASVQEKETVADSAALLEPRARRLNTGLPGTHGPRTNGIFNNMPGQSHQSLILSD